MFKDKKTKIKEKIIKNNKLNSIEDTINYIKKFISKMDKEHLDIIENHILKKPKSDALDLWLQIIEERKKELK